MRHLLVPLSRSTAIAAKTAVTSLFAARRHVIAACTLIALTGLSSAQAEAQLVFQETFGSTGSTNGQLPTAQSTADGNWAIAECGNGNLVSSGPGDSPSDDGTGSTAFLRHFTDRCSYAADEAVWRTISEIPVQPNSSYVFSYWSLIANTVRDPVLTQGVTPNDGGSITITNRSAPSWPAVNTWVRSDVTFTTDANTTSVSLRITNGNIETVGNDFGLDDIRLARAQPIFWETFGSTMGQLPTELSTADGNWASVGCQNGMIVNDAPDSSSDDSTGSTAFLLHFTGDCSFSADEAVWRTISEISVQPNSSYVFSYWSLIANTVGDPIVLTQGVTPNAGGSITITSGSTPSWPAPGTWVKRYVTFTTGANTTSVSLRINNSNTGGIGNDFGLDDIRLARLAAFDEFHEGFDDITLLPGAGWALVNNSAPVGPSSWFQGNAQVFPAHEGAPNSYIGANYQNAGFGGTISNWLITPEVTIVNGTELRFWTRKTPQLGEFSDRLEVRLSVAGASVEVGDTADSVGDFTQLLLTINENVEPGAYPEAWTEYVVTVGGQSRAPVTGRFAFRYWVPRSNSDYLGIDTVSVTQPGGDQDSSTITHSTSLDILEHFTGTCQSTIGTTTENQHLRTFTLTDFGITGAFGVTAVTFGVQEVSGATAPITVNLYTLDGDVAYENMTPIGSTTVDVPPQELTLVTVPVTGEAPAGSTLVVEIAVPNLTDLGGVFTPGSNNLGETAPSYWASSCFNGELASYADRGRPDVHLVMTVTGAAETGVGATSSARPAQTSLGLPSAAVPGGWRAEPVRIGSRSAAGRSRWHPRVR